MRLTTILLLASATTAEANVMPWQQTAGLKSVVKQMADKHGRRLQAALMSAQCQEQCAGVMEMLTFLASGDMGEDPPIEKVLEGLCPYKDTVGCVASTDVCKDEGSAELMAYLGLIPCLCDCPAMADMENFEKDAPSDDTCAAISCAMAEAACAPLQEMVKADEDAQTTVSNCDAKTTTAPATTSVAPAQAAPAVFTVLSVLSMFA
jgi:hypothetical protein